MPIWGNKMSIRREAEKSNPVASAFEEYERYRSMSYQDASNLFKDVQCVLEVKGILEDDTAGITNYELSNLVANAKRIGDLANSYVTMINARKKSSGEEIK